MKKILWVAGILVLTAGVAQAATINAGVNWEATDLTGGEVNGFTVTVAADGTDWLYTWTKTGNLDGLGTSDDTLSFKLRSAAFTGSSYSSPDVTLGTPHDYSVGGTVTTPADQHFGPGYDLDNNQSFQFSIENISFSQGEALGWGAKFNGFSAISKYGTDNTTYYVGTTGAEEIFMTGDGNLGFTGPVEVLTVTATANANRFRDLDFGFTTTAPSYFEADTTGFWTNAANWTAGVPGGDDNAFILGGAVATLDTTTNVNELTVADTATLIIASNGVLTASSDVTFRAGSTCAVEIGPGASGKLIVNGDFTVNSTSSELAIDASAYDGGSTNIDLVIFSSMVGTFDTNNISVIGHNVKEYSVGYDGDSMFLNLVYYGAGETVLIGQDDNDGNETYLSRVRSGNRQDVGVTWKRCNRMTVANPDFVDASLFTADGTPTNDTSDVLGFLESSKTDNIFGMYRGGVAGGTLTYTFNIAGYNHLSMAVDFAGTGDIFDEGIRMAWSIDGGPVVTNLAIGRSTADWVQTMEDGRAVTNANSGAVTVNGVGAAKLSDEFQTYTPSISGTGSVLTVTLSMSSASGGPEAFGMDNLKLSGDVIPEVGDTLAIGNDDFDGDALYMSRTASDWENRENLMFAIVDRTTVTDHRMIDTTVASNDYVALDVDDTNGWLQSDKTDSFLAMYRGLGRTLTYTFDIAGYEDLNMALDLVASGVWAAPNITLAYSIDGGTSVTNLVVDDSTVDSIDTMEIGTSVTNAKTATVTVNGVLTNALTDAFQTYTPTITGTGSVMTVTLTHDSGSGNQAFGLDNLVLYGTVSEPPAPAPVAGNLEVERQAGSGFKVHVDELLAVCSDPAGLPFGISSVAALSASNQTITVADPWIFYSPASGFAEDDRYSFSITNSLGGTAQGWVLITIADGDTLALSVTPDVNGDVSILSSGIPGRMVVVQASSNLTSGVWMDLDTNTFSAVGVSEFTETNAPSPRFYRLQSYTE